MVCLGKNYSNSINLLTSHGDCSTLFCGDCISDCVFTDCPHCHLPVTANSLITRRSLSHFLEAASKLIAVLPQLSPDTPHTVHQPTLDSILQRPPSQPQRVSVNLANSPDISSHAAIPDSTPPHTSSSQFRQISHNITSSPPDTPYITHQPSLNSTSLQTAQTQRVSSGLTNSSDTSLHSTFFDSTIQQTSYSQQIPYAVSSYSSNTHSTHQFLLNSTSPQASSLQSKRVLRHLTSCSPKRRSLALLAHSGYSLRDLRVLLQEASSLDLVLSSTLSQFTTHLIVYTDAHNRCSRTLKYMKALLSGTCIVTENWLHQSVARKRLLDSSDFCPAGDGHNHDQDVALTARSSKVRGEPPLFDGLFIFFDCQTHMPRREVIGLVEAGGAVVVRSVSHGRGVPFHAAPGGIIARCPFIRIVGGGKAAIQLEGDWVTASEEWIFDCISDFKLNE